MPESAYTFRPQDYEAELSAIIAACHDAPALDDAALQGILRRHPKDGRGFFSKSEIIRGYRWLAARGSLSGSEEEFLRRMRMKPVRTRSGVAPVTVLTQPFPCPGRCIFCPSDVRMPKSYLSSEPGAQRAAEHRFDPYHQTRSRLEALAAIGHPVDKVELIVLGGTWSSYPESYRLWFLTGCFRALNDFEAPGREPPQRRPAPARECDGFAFEQQEDTVRGAAGGPDYNQAMTSLFARHPHSRPQAEGLVGWGELEAAQTRNESAFAHCVGLSLETRPDAVSEQEVVHLRRFGATKVQIGYQSLDDRVLRLNRRGHDTAATRRAMQLLRGAGFKIQAHWMPNLYGSSPDNDVRDFVRMFEDADFRPDELKIYPCALVKSAELMRPYEEGSWRPYDQEELRQVLAACLLATPRYCRLSRVVRDIPSTDIVDGNKLTNFRELVEESLRLEGEQAGDVRSREIRGLSPRREELRLKTTEYATSVGREVFLELVTADDRLAAFVRLSLPRTPPAVPEIAGSSVIREVHVYGELVGLGDRSGGGAQHRGLGRELVAEARLRSRDEGYRDLAVISAVGTRDYYRRLGFRDGALYQHLELTADRARPAARAPDS